MNDHELFFEIAPKRSGSDSRLVFLGDVFLPTPYRVALRTTGSFGINLEHPITARGKEYPGKIILKADKNFLPQTFGTSLSVACLANNHILDKGPEGLQDTISELEVMGVKWFGAGVNQAQLRNPIVVPVRGVPVGLAGYVCPTTTPVFATADAPGVAPLDLELIAADIRKARTLGAQRVVIALHWGAEEVGYPRPEDIVTARKIVDLGVDLIIGHHAHCMQPVEIYRGKHIFYGLGNAIMPDLDIPSYYDRTGAPTSRFVKRQRAWNRNSLAVAYDPEKQEVACLRLCCSGDKVVQARSLRRYRHLPSADMVKHEKLFRRALFLARTRESLLYVLGHPTFPKARHFRKVWTIARDTLARMRQRSPVAGLKP